MSGPLCHPGGTHFVMVICHHCILVVYYNLVAGGPGYEPELIIKGAMVIALNTIT